MALKKTFSNQKFLIEQAFDCRLPKYSLQCVDRTVEWNGHRGTADTKENVGAEGH